MKAAAVALRGLASRIASAVGIEGAFLLAGTVLLAIGSSYIVSFGPWIVAGSMCILAGISLAIPERRR